MPYNPYMMNYQQPPLNDALNQLKYPYAPPQYTQPQAAPAQYNDMIWVLGEVEATSYPVAPNSTVTLWDKNQPTIYVKSVNIQGVPSTRILDFTERTAQAAQPKHECACGKDYEVLNSRIAALEEQIKTLQKPQEE